jgi:hypothetical protein
VPPGTKTAFREKAFLILGDIDAVQTAGGTMTPEISIRQFLSRTPLRAAHVWNLHRGLAENDLFLAAYPKSGSTWLRFLVGGILVGEDIGFDRAKSVIPIVGHHRDAPDLLPGGGRILKTHEKYRPIYRRAVLLVRDPRDTAISYYYHQLRQEQFAGSFEKFLSLFVAGKLAYGCWYSHLLSWIDSPLAPTGNLLVVKYEDLKHDPFRQLGAVLEFMGINLPAERITGAIEGNTLSEMRKKEKSATVLKVRRTDIPVVREGKAQGWRAQLTRGQNELVAQRDRAGLLERLGYTKHFD